jgi:colicin import membrane protein
MATADRLDFTPPPPPGFLRGMGLALLAHVLLVIALTYGLRWNRDDQPVSAEAELWSAVPQEAAPKEVPQPPPVPQPPIVRAPPLPEPPVQRDAQIALEREKKQREAAERREEELERERDKRRKLEAQKKQEEKQQQALDRKKELQAKAAEKRRKEEELARKQEQDTKKLAQQREENLRRMQGLAVGSGSDNAKGSAAQSAGPSASWAGRVQARVKPNIVFTDDFSGNPKAEVEVRMAPDGTIVGKRVVKSSGNKAWDEAVLRALDKTEMLPRDVDGRVHSPVVIEFRPKG